MVRNASVLICDYPYCRSTYVTIDTTADELRKQAAALYRWEITDTHDLCVLHVGKSHVVAPHGQDKSHPSSPDDLVAEIPVPPNDPKPW